MMIHRSLALLFCLLVLGACSAVATAGHGADDSAEAWLERIEARAADVNTLQARIIYTTIQGLLGDEQRRVGTLAYDSADPKQDVPTRFAVHFDRVIIDGSMRMQDRGYTFDGIWLGERIIDGNRKVFIRRQLTRDGESNDLLSLGDGPFAVPLDLKKNNVLRKYEVSVIDADSDEDAQAVHLRLIPRPGTDVEQKQIDLWFDRDSLLPVRVRSINQDQTESIIELRNAEVNPSLQTGTFDTTPPRDQGWEIEIKPLES